MSCFDLAHAPVATTARAAATEPVSMSTRPDPEGSDTVEIATRIMQCNATTYQVCMPSTTWHLPGRRVCMAYHAMYGGDEAIHFGRRAN